MRLSLRTLLVGLFLGSALYVGVLAAFLVWRIGSAALSLGSGTASVVTRLEELQHRHDGLDRAEDLARTLVNRPDMARDARLTELRRLLDADTLLPHLTPLADVPDELRGRMSTTDERLDALRALLSETFTLIDRRRGDAAMRLPRVEALHADADIALSETSARARGHLIDRQMALQQATRDGLRAAVAWLVLGALLLPLGVYVVRRRVWAPLRRLEEGLARVAEGDLTTRLDVGRDDEIGRLAAHFNAMTKVLRDRAEEQGRFAAAGELLAGVAHEVNNPLMAISAQAELRLADPDTTTEQRAETQQILRQAQRATKLLRGLLRFVRVGERRVAAVNLNDVIRSAIDLVSYRFGVDEISVGGRLDPNLPPVQGDAIRLEQVLVNLLSNAVDALRGVPPPRHLTVDSWVADDQVLVSVADSGPGVHAEIANRLFHPFATTKGRSGTGLGLYISRQIVRESGGDLVLTSRAGQGARFEFHLAVSSTPAELARTPPVGTPGAAHALAGLRILLVDDEELVRSPMARYLKRRGATVFEASDGLQALERLASQEVDVIVADLRMPRLDGAGLYARLQAERPALADRLLFLSGDITHLAGRGLAPVPRERVMVKPVELAELEQRVRDFAAWTS